MRYAIVPVAAMCFLFCTGCAKDPWTAKVHEFAKKQFDSFLSPGIVSKPFRETCLERAGEPFKVRIVDVHRGVKGAKPGSLAASDSMIVVTALISGPKGKLRASMFLLENEEIDSGFAFFGQVRILD
ncbi:hypothetical protein ACFL2T_04085 [Elusimicrobiota bacterium]